MIMLGANSLVAFIVIAIVTHATYLDIATVRPQLFSFVFLFLLQTILEDVWSAGAVATQNLRYVLVLSNTFACPLIGQAISAILPNRIFGLAKISVKRSRQLMPVQDWYWQWCFSQGFLGLAGNLFCSVSAGQFCAQPEVYPTNFVHGNYRCADVIVASSSVGYSFTLPQV